MVGSYTDMSRARPTGPLWQVTRVDSSWYLGAGKTHLGRQPQGDFPPLAHRSLVMWPRLPDLSYAGHAVGSGRPLTFPTLACC